MRERRKQKKTSNSSGWFLKTCMAMLVFFLCAVSPVLAIPADYQRCKTGDNCTIGEFLYDDEYVPIITGSCTLTSRDPSGAIFLNSVAMTANSDGWYSYVVSTTGATEGLYRSQMCCTESTNYLCMDKSFYIGPSYLSASEVENAVWNAQTNVHPTPGTFGANVQNPVLTAASIWGYTNRTLSGFGTLIADIWSYSTRSLTTFGTLVSDMWTNPTRTLSSTTISSTEHLASREELKGATESAVAIIRGSDNKSLTTIATDLSSVKSTVEGFDAKLNTIKSSTDSISTLLSKWGTYSATDIYDKVKNLSTEIASVNTVSNTSAILNITQATDTTKELLNKLISMQALLEVNRILLQGNVTEPITRTWLEEGSIIFKSLVMNPSTTETKVVPFKYYLPSEVKPDDIIKMDEELTLVYDPAENKRYIYSEVTLKPQAVKIFAVEVKDVWVITKEDVAPFRKQVATLFEPLKKTAFFAQGASLKSDIELGLDKVLQLQKNVFLPEARIKAYKDASTELTLAKSKIANLKTLLASAGSANAVVGSVGGIQLFSVWGMVIVLISGVAFLAWYMKTLKMHGAITPATPSTPPIDHEKKSVFSRIRQGRRVDNDVVSVPVHAVVMHTNSHFNKMPAIIGIVLFVGGIVLGTVVSSRMQSSAPIVEKSAKKTGTVSRDKIDTVLGVQNENRKAATKTAIQASTIRPVKVYVLPLETSRTVVALTESTDVTIKERTPNWMQVSFAGSTGWVLSEFVVDVEL